MRAGELTEVISILRPVAEETAYGSQSVTLVNVARLRARVKYGRGWRSAADGGEIVYAKSVYFTIRPHKNVSPSDVVEYRGERFRIIATEYHHHDREVELTAELIND